MGFVVAFTVLGILFHPEARLAQVLWTNFVIANRIGYLIHLGFKVSRWLLGSSLHNLSPINGPVSRGDSIFSQPLKCRVQVQAQSGGHPPSCRL